MMGSCTSLSIGLINPCFLFVEVDKGLVFDRHNTCTGQTPLLSSEYIICRSNISFIIRWVARDPQNHRSSGHWVRISREKLFFEFSKASDNDEKAYKNETNSNKEQNICHLTGN